MKRPVRDRSRRHRRAAALALAALTSSAGCALIVGNVDGDLRVDASTGPDHDGGRAADTRLAPGDVGRDGELGSVDAPRRSGDGGPDVVAHGDAGGSPCAEPHTFCDDFDHDDAGVASKWTGSTGPSTAGSVLPILAISDAYSVSAPDSLHLQVGATSDSVAYLTEIFAGPIATLDCAFDARFAAPPSAPLLSVSVGYDDVGLGLGATSSLGSCYYPPPDAAAGCNGGATVPTPSPGVWKHVTFELDVGSGTFVLDYDGAAVGSASLVGALPNDSASVTLTLGFNVPYNAVGPLDVYIDNFYCDVSP